MEKLVSNVSENQVGQIANALNSRTQETLPSDTVNARPHRKEHCKAITLRSGTQLDRFFKSVVAETSNLESDQSKILEQHKKSTTNEKTGPSDAKANFDSTVEHNIWAKQSLQPEVRPPLPFPQRFQNHEQDQQFRKRRLREFETTALTKGCTTMLTNKLPPKLKDLGSFTIPCSIGNQYVGKALCNLGASINLMPLSMFKKLGIGEARPTT
ncbi:uncharacterized protein [Gossypium hirsutum]|uniref:Uncharacterized protein n=1 Tax=Gossypium hirsutum TaxID=3635 RepID=A0A1U8L0F0_GOSHI|nr:uncharacterized protein LOC107921486 [Gossypium hirsutum]